MSTQPTKGFFSRMRKPALWLLVPFALLLVTAATVFLCNRWVSHSAQGLLYTNVADIPANNVGLVLGTSSSLVNGMPNLYFKYRIDAAASLYHAGKVKHLIVSGDNSVKHYNEPEEMKLALMAKGVPESAITLDFAGFRTLDSVVRCSKVFGQKRFTVISQEFHNIRALFIAQRYGIEAVGFNARAVSGRANNRTVVREPLARCKAVLDLYILNKQPHFLGKPERVVI